MGFGPSPAKPAKVAAQQAAANKSAAEITQAGRVDQNLPGLQQNFTFGDIDPVTGLRKQTVTNTLSPENQALYNQELGTRFGVGQGIGSLVANSQDILGNPFDMTRAGFDETLGGAGLIANVNRPFWEMQNRQLDAQLRNQGFVPGRAGDERNAYNNRFRQQGMDQFLQFQGAVLPWQQQVANQKLQSYNTIGDTISRLFGFSNPSFPVAQGQYTPFTAQAPNMADINKTYHEQATARSAAIGKLVGTVAGSMFGPMGAMAGGAIGGSLAG